MGQEKWRTQLDRITDIIVEGIIILNKESAIVFANPRAGELLGIKLASIIGSKFPDNEWTFSTLDGKPFPVEDFPFWRVMETRKAVYGVEYVLTRPDGAQITVSVSAAPLLDERGEVEVVALSLTDISKAREVSEEVLETRRQILDVLESITDGFFALDNQWRFTYVNQQAAKLVGKKREVLLFRNIWQAFSELAGTRFEREFRRAKEDMVPAVFEEFYSPLARWLEVHIYPFEGGLSIYASDITERKQAEEKLRKSEEKLKAIAEQSKHGIFIGTTDGKAIFYNKAMEDILGYTLEEVNKYGWFNLIYPQKEIRELAIKEARQALQKKTAYVEAPIFRKNKELAWLSLSMSHLDVSGKDYILGIATDITGRQRVEGAKEEGEEQYRLLLELSPDGISVSIDGRIAYINATAVKMLGAKNAGELIGRSIYDFLHPDYRDTEARRTKQVQQGEWQGYIEEKFLRVDGSPFDVEVASAPAIYQGRPAIQTVFHDTTERKN